MSLSSVNLCGMPRLIDRIPTIRASLPGGERLFKVQLHFTPTYSWLNRVELWFAKIQRDLLSRGIFTSVADLARQIRKYIS